MNLLEQFLLNQQNKAPSLSPMQTPEQFAQNQQLSAQRQGLAENLMKTGGLRGVQNFLIHPTNALFGIKSPQQEVPISYQQPLVGIDMSQQDYNNAENQGLLPENTMMSAGVKENPRVGGLLRDFSSGLNDNLNNRFNVDNLEPSNKGLATRIGEGIGTGLRVLNSPVGRGLLTAGIVGASGGNGLQALAYGATAGVKNQNLVTQDKMYRKALEDNGIDTSNISGYIDGDMYKNYTMGVYRNRSLDIREQLGLLGDNTKRAGLIRNLLNSGNITPEEAQIRMAEYGITAKDLAVSNQTRNADVNQYLAPAKKYAYETAPQIAMGNLALGQLKADPNYQAAVAGATKGAEVQATNIGKDINDYNTYVAKMPELKAQVENLNKLAKDATYTVAGVAKDSVTRQLGLPVGKGAVARTEYMATINNQILPLLRETFGAQFTEREGEALRQSLGDLNKSPAEKQAVLDAFIRQKEMNIKSQARKIQQYGGSVATPQTSQPKVERSMSKSGKPIIKVNGVWQYE